MIIFLGVPEIYFFLVYPSAEELVAAMVVDLLAFLVEALVLLVVVRPSAPAFSAFLVVASVPLGEASALLVEALVLQVEASALLVVAAVCPHLET